MERNLDDCEKYFCWRTKLERSEEKEMNEKIWFGYCRGRRPGFRSPEHVGHAVPKTGRHVRPGWKWRGRRARRSGRSRRRRWTVNESVSSAITTTSTITTKTTFIIIIITMNITQWIHGKKSDYRKQKTQFLVTRAVGEVAYAGTRKTEENIPVFFFQKYERTWILYWLLNSCRSITKRKKNKKKNSKPPKKSSTNPEPSALG